MEPVARNVINTLCDLGLLTHQELVDGSSILIMGRQRNRFTYFKQLSGRSFFIKSAHEGEPGTRESIALEAALYNCFSDTAQFHELRQFLIEVHHYDPDAAAIFMTYLPNTQSVGTMIRRDPGLEITMIEDMARVLAMLHAAPLSVLPEGLRFARKPHWVFRLRESPSPLPSLRSRGPAAVEWVESVLADAPLMALLDELGRNWPMQSLIHGDIKNDNILVVPGREVIKLIDWERADIGDPAFDIGCGAAGFIIDRAGANAASNHSTVLTPRISAEIRGYLDSYFQDKPDPDLKMRALDMICARLAVAAYEIAHQDVETPAPAKRLLALASRLAALDATSRHHLILGDIFEQAA